MSLFRSLDANGDWVWGQGIQAYASGQNAIALSCQTRLLSFLNDCFFDPLGVVSGWIDWFNLLGSSNQTALIFSIQSILWNTPGVNSVTQIYANLDPKTRVLTARYSVTTVYGASISNEIVFPVAPFEGVQKYVGDVFFNGSQTTQTVVVSSTIPNAEEAIWMLYDESDYTLVAGAVSILNETTVTITINPAPPAGYFRLVGIY